LPARPRLASPAPPPAVAPRQFSPLIPFAAFGWLPAGNRLISGGTGPASSYQVAGPNPGKTPWIVNVYAAGRCHLSVSAQDLDCPASHITGRAPAVHGHRAFWASPDQGGQALAWQYARGGWAVLLFFPDRPQVPWQPEAMKIAEHLRYGVRAAPPLAFPIRLTGVPASWHVSSVGYRPHGAVLQATQWWLTTGPANPHALGESHPSFTFDLATPRSSCPIFPHGQSAHQVINGYPVIVSHIPTGGLPIQQLCAAHANGLRVRISELGNHPGLGVVSLFAHHLQLLGTNAANWAKTPIG
jgi:hypothetical protein